jgi:glutaconate CoA-transferase subunit A|tara:strand:+ start:840 stop:1643 length:804 start_codon:yes stop_codon:yes gene_type:complete
MAYISINELANRINDSSLLVIPPDYSFVSMSATWALIKRKARKLRLVAAPQTGLQADLLIGSGCVAEIETAAVSLGEFGIAPRFAAAVKSGEIAVKDSTCPAIHAALQASEKGIPFMPLRGIIGSDILANRPDWRLCNNPFEKNFDDPVVLLPAIKPDFALFHAPFADIKGNVWIGKRRELALMAHAAKKTYVTVEKIEQTDFMSSEDTAAAALPALYVHGISESPNGAWPLGLVNNYKLDRENIMNYAMLAQSDDGFIKYIENNCP